MPKISGGARKRRQRDREVAANLHHDRTRPQKATYTSAYRHWIIVRVAGFALMVVGVVMAVAHIGAHLGNVQMVPLQDLLIGWPLAGVLFIAGGVLASRQLRT